MLIKAVFLDLDGTSLNQYHELSPKLISVLKQLRQQKTEIVFSTGRSFASSQRFAQEIGGCHYIINYNGARIYDFHQKKILRETILPSTVIQKVFEFSKIHRYLPIFYHNNMVFTEKEYKHNNKSLYEGETFKELSPDRDWSQEDLTKALFVIPETKMESLRTQAINYFDDASVYTSASNYLEIMPQGINKSTAVKKILDQLNISPNEAAAFGDQLNDLEMLTLVKHGYVMENATPLLQQSLPLAKRAQRNSEDGVANTLISLFNLN